MQNKEKSLKNFTFLWIGQLVSILGSGLTSFGMGVWIFTKTGRATPLALSVLFATLPHIVLSPLAGLFADRYNKKLIMIIADIGAACTTVVLLVLLYNGQLVTWNIYLIALLNSTFSVFETPALQASVVMLVPKEKLGRANGMNQITNALETLITPLLAGILYSVIGLYGIIVIDFITFFIAIVFIIFIPTSYFQGNKKEENSNKTIEPKKVLNTIFKDSLEGFIFIKQRKGLLVMMLFFAVVNFFLNLSIVLLAPLVLSLGNPVSLGTVQMVGGIGMLLGSLFATVKKRENCLVKRIYFAIFFVACSLFIMGVRDSIALISIGRFLFLFFVPLSNSSAFAIWQLKGPSDMQGRLFAARQMLARSIMPIAYLIVGPLVDGILKPALKKDTYFNNIVGYLIGNGAGAAYRVVFVFSGIILLTLVFILLSYKPLKNLEVELPDF